MKIFQPLGASILAVTILAAAVAIPSGAADEEIDTAPAMAAAQSWLATVDAGRLDESWTQGSEYFRKNVTREKWVSAASAVRGETGILLGRKVRTMTYTHQLPNAPEGESVVILFDARFDRIINAVETVTTMRDPDGSWKVAGYYVKPL